MSPRRRHLALVALLLAGCFHGVDVTSQGQDTTTTATAADTSSGTTAADASSSTGTSSTTAAATTGDPAEATALRITKLSIVDPHIYYVLDGQNCVDTTALLNSAGIQNYIDDGDSNLVFIFSPLDPTASSTPARFAKAACNLGGTTTCAPSKDYQAADLSAENLSAGVCSTVLDGSLNPSYAVDGAPNIASAPCFHTPPFDLELPLTPQLPNLPLRQVQVSAHYTTSDEDASLVAGSIRGYLRASDALQVAGELVGQPFDVWGTVAGGNGCQIDPNMPIDDTDPNPIAGDADLGAWLYLNFEAQPVIWLE